MKSPAPAPAPIWLRFLVWAAIAIIAAFFGLLWVCLAACAGACFTLVFYINSKIPK